LTGQIRPKNDHIAAPEASGYRNDQKLDHFAAPFSRVRILVEAGGEWADDARPLSGVDGNLNPRLDLGRVLPAVAIIAFWIWLTRRMFRGTPSRKARAGAAVLDLACRRGCAKDLERVIICAWARCSASDP
jgi:hypothetical protein